MKPSAHESPAKEQSGEVASMVKRLDAMALVLGAHYYNIPEVQSLLREAAKLLAKLGQSHSPFVVNWTTEGCPKHHGQPWTMGSVPIYIEIGKRCPICDPPPPERP